MNRKKPYNSKDHVVGIKKGRDSSRRDFIKLLGYGAGATALFSACEQPVRKMIPYLIHPEEVIPGKAFYYSTSYFQEGEFNPIIVKVRDGRPIKIEGNEIPDTDYGGSSAKIQASILDLYNPDRLKYPIKNRHRATFDEVDEEIVNTLTTLRESGEKVYLVTPTIISPSTKHLFSDFKEVFPNVEVVVFDPISYSAIKIANEKCFGIKQIPDYKFDKAQIIVAFNADFLGTWLSPVEFTKRYSGLKDPGGKMVKHYQFETTYTITGANADKRIPINPSEELIYLGNLYNAVAESTGSERINVPAIEFDLRPVAEELVENSGAGIVISGTNDRDIQIIVNAINYLTKNVSSTIDFSNPFLTRECEEDKVEQMISTIISGEVGGFILYDSEPSCIFSKSEKLKEAIEGLPLSAVVGTFPIDQMHHFKYVIPANHFLESWNDAEPKPNLIGLCQPMIKPLFDTRQGQDSLLKWMLYETDFYSYLKKYWNENIYPKSASNYAFGSFWNECLQNGLIKIDRTSDDIELGMNSNVFQEIEFDKFLEIQDEIEIHLYEPLTNCVNNPSLNPWLLDLPDPITKLCWENAAILSNDLAEKLEVEDGQIVSISNQNSTIRLPLLIQQGQAKNSVSIALGFGRKSNQLGRAGACAFPLIELGGGLMKYWSSGRVKPLQEKEQLALGQLHSSMEGRDLIREVNLSEYLNETKLFESGSQHPTVKPFYKTPEFPGYHWGIVVDLNKCTGCNTCVIACQAENNIPVVGKTEVIRKHEMHWMRIDRYFKGSDENAEVVMQPVMCQHCDFAPCENVCPVAATNHSSEGINQMVYNRCIGTRYCENNCPYKVRRFNWYDYTKADPIKNNEEDIAGMTRDLPRMVLNPDVTVRSKGVIEKCSFCFQRIVEGKNRAKLENRLLRDGEIRPACMQACPANAIIFGDMNDSESKISKALKSKRGYHLLKELNTLPSVTYLAKVKNDIM